MRIVKNCGKFAYKSVILLIILEEIRNFIFNSCETFIQIIF